MPTILSVSDFKQNAASMIKEVNETASPLFLTQNGRQAAVLVSPSMWKSAQDTRAMLKLLCLSENNLDGDKDFDVTLDNIEAMVEAHGK